MAQKTLKIKRVFAWAIFSSLKNTPPKDYPTTGEIKSTINVVLPSLKTHLGEYTAKIDEATALNDKMISKEITEAQLKTAVDKINDGWRIYNKEHGNEIIDIVLDDEGFKTLKDQFDRDGWGKNWLANIEEFDELLKAFAEAGK